MVERLNPEGVANLDIHLYGITSDPTVLGAAKETIIDNLEEYYDENGDVTLGEDEVSLSEVALAIPISSDVIWGITGRHGIDLTRLDFAYEGRGGEGIRESSFMSTTYRRGTVALSSLRDLVLADGSYHIKEYLMKYKKGQPMVINKKVQRQGPAASTPMPAPPAPGAAGAAPGGTPVVSSLRELLEGFLDGSTR
jgi:hypothetical protein